MAECSTKGLWKYWSEKFLKYFSLFLVRKLRRNIEETAAIHLHRQRGGFEHLRRGGRVHPFSPILTPPNIRQLHLKLFEHKMFLSKQSSWVHPLTHISPNLLENYVKTIILCWKLQFESFPTKIFLTKLVIETFKTQFF